jgi:hypothetical protein
VEVSTGLGWARMPQPAPVRVAVPNTRLPAYRIWSARLGPLAPGARFRYRVLLDGREVCNQEAVARKAPGQPQRVAVAGDLVEGNGHDRAIAFRMHAQNPDLVVGVGDLVYGLGTQREYRERFFPTYNANAANPAVGAPIMRSRPMVGVLGNHDVGLADRKGLVPPQDSLAYYLNWDQPLNGPDLLPHGHVPSLTPPGAWDAFRQAAGARYPRMGSFTFRSGDVHWTILDSNGYVDWNDPDLRAWLERELALAQDARWRFVAFHHAAFNLSTFDHTGDWQMRALWPVFERHHVDLVFTGHLHTYQRTRPLSCTPPPGAGTGSGKPGKGSIVVDAQFDGARQTRARYPIHILTGAGGADSYNTTPPRKLKRYHARLVDGINSFSQLDIQGDHIEFRQIAADGRELDHFVLTK